MQINLAVEKDCAFLNIEVCNFPYKFTFMDRTTGIMVTAELDEEALNGLLEDIDKKIRLKKQSGKEQALMKIREMLDVYEDDDWDFITSWFTHQEVLQIEMKKK